MSSLRVKDPLDESRVLEFPASMSREAVREALAARVSRGQDATAASGAPQDQPTDFAAGLEESLATPPTGFPVLNPNPRVAGKLPQLPGGGFAEAEQLPGDLAVAGGLLGPLALGPAGLPARMLTGALSMAGGRQAGRAITGQPAGGVTETLQEAGTDLGIGALGEFGGTALAWGLGTVGKLGFAIGRGIKPVAGAGKEVVKEVAGKQSAKLWTRLRELVPAKAPVPAPRTLAVLDRLKAGRWKNPEVAELAIGARGTPLLGKLKAAHSADDAFRVGYPAPASTAVEATLQATPRPGWDPHYFVFDNGQGILAFRNTGTGVWVDGTKAAGKATTKSITEQGIGRVLSKQASGANLVASVPAPPLPGGKLAQYLSGFQLQRQPTITFDTLNDLMSNSTSFPGFANMGPNGRALATELRDAVRADVMDHGPAVEKAVQGALRWGRVAKGSLKAGPKIAKGAAKLGIVGGSELIRE